MRTLRVVVRTARGAVPILVTASVVPATACGGSDATDVTTQSAGASGGPSTGGAGTSTGGATTGGEPAFGGFFASGGLGGSGGSTFNDCEYTVSLPPEGVPAEPGQICAATVTPVESNRAARVRFGYPHQGDLMSVQGSVEIAPALAGTIVGTPTLQIIDASEPRLLDFVVTSVQVVAGGFSFTGAFQPPQNFSLGLGATRVTVRVTLEVDCPPVTQIVHASTDIHLCGDMPDDAEWASSGEVCSVCRIIAEMAPSPIIPAPRKDDLPLAQAMRLRIVELARVSGTVVLFAENDGGAELEYEWHASSGRLEPLAPDIVAWTVEDGMAAPFVQAAVWGESAAAVATWAFNAEVA